MDHGRGALFKIPVETLTKPIGGKDKKLQEEK